MIYRGQKYGDPVGEWWTTSLAEASSFAMSRGGNRTYIVLALDDDNEEWLSKFLMFNRSDSGNGGDWYRIPITDLRARWSGITILSGVIDLEFK